MKEGVDAAVTRGPAEVRVASKTIERTRNNKERTRSLWKETTCRPSS
jgi:hypothetical protein